MTRAVGDFAKETVSRIGPSAYLVNILPSAVIVLTTWALFVSHLLPWDSVTYEGPAAVVQGARDLGIAGGIVLAVLILVVAILLRPFQISAVQLLEGYWHRRLGPRLFEAMAVERQVRTAEIHRAWARYTQSTSPDTGLETFALHYRQQRRRQRKAFDSQQALKTYPADREIFLPTRLGNTLRKAETTAGERYGLNTVVTYQRLYPHLSPQMDRVMGNRLDLIDTTCAFVFVFITLTGVTSPLFGRADWWGLVPLGFLALAGISYRGARSTAERYIVSLCAAFDLHRFDMLRALHRKLPHWPETELIENQELSQFLAQDGPWPKDIRRAYDHGD